MTLETHPEERKEISCRVTRTLLTFVREQNGGSLGPLLDDLPFDEGYLADTNNWVSHALLQRLYHRMIAILGDDNAVYRMTLAAEKFRSLGILDRIVRLLGSPKRIYSQAPKYNRYLKLNGSVFIHDIGDTWVVLEDRYHDSAQKTRFDCDYTRGVLAGIPTLFGLPLAEVEEIQCQVAPETYGRRIWPDSPSQGSASCLYRVRWTPEERSLWKRWRIRKEDPQKAIEELAQANRLIQAKYDEVKTLMHDLERANRELNASKKSLEAQKAALMESERKYRLLAENISDTIWVIDLETLKFTYISPSVEKNRGFSVAEAMALDLAQTLSATSYTMVAEILAEELAKEAAPEADPQRSRTVEIEHTVKSGGYRWAEATVSFVRGRDGKPTAIMGVTRDITDRKEAQRRIAESERKYRNLFENGSDLICIHDLEGNLLDTNLPYKTSYGWRREDLAGVNIRTLLPERHLPRFDDYLTRIRDHGEDEGYMKGFTKSGEAVVLEYRNKLMLDDNGEPVAVYGAARDITRRFRYEKALKESEEKYKNIVQHAPAGIYEIDLQRMRFVSVNDVMCGYTGHSQAAFLALDPAVIFDTESRPTFRRLLETVITDKPQALSTEFRIKRQSGGSIAVMMNTRFFYEDGAPKRAMAVVHDLTEIRRAEEEKRLLEAKLHNAKKLESLGTLAGGVAHDLNNILSGIVSYPDLLLHTMEPDSPLRKPLTTIKKSGQKAAEIVQDLLTLARRSVSTKRVVDLNHIVKDFLDSPEYGEILRERKDLTVSTNFTQAVLKLMGSETHISKAVMNLVQNAADAMPTSGRLRVATGSRYIDTAHGGFETIPMGEYVLLEVSDTGVGIAPSELERIFEPFYTKKVLGRSGTGLGMSVVWGTIKDHEGYVDITTAQGEGTTFTLYFPAARGEIEIQPSVDLENYRGNGESILVIDDAEEQRDLASRMMRQLGYEVASASSGEEAIRRVRERAFDLLILDMIMPPGIDGLETYKRICDIVPGQKAVIASGYSQTDNVKAAQRLGAGSYVKKPYTLANIGLAVRKTLHPDHK
ncbi:MAG: PAS domain S-box protein [Desulfosarcinaceae bacterium]|nr:PAS domain S-box protein [Desulfosarcinaceae bacterium]